MFSGISKFSFPGTIPVSGYSGFGKFENFVVGVGDLSLWFFFLFSLRLILIFYYLISKARKRIHKNPELFQYSLISLIKTADVFFQMLYNLLKSRDLKFLACRILWIKLKVNQLSILIQEFRFNLLIPLLVLPIVFQSHLYLFKELIEFIFLWLLPIFIVVWL